MSDFYFLFVVVAVVFLLFSFFIFTCLKKHLKRDGEPYKKSELQHGKLLFILVPIASCFAYILFFEYIFPPKWTCANCNKINIYITRKSSGDSSSKNPRLWIVNKYQICKICGNEFLNVDSYRDWKPFYSTGEKISRRPPPRTRRQDGWRIESWREIKLLIILKK